MFEKYIIAQPQSSQGQKTNECITLHLIELITTRTETKECITPHLIELHWLSVIRITTRTENKWMYYTSPQWLTTLAASHKKDSIRNINPCILMPHQYCPHLPLINCSIQFAASEPQLLHYWWCQHQNLRAMVIESLHILPQNSGMHFVLAE